MKHYDFRLLLVALAGVSVLATPAAALVCGDSEPDAGEQCDDGNTAGGDGCSPTCTVEPSFICSDAIPGDPVPVPAIPPVPSVCSVPPFGNTIFVRGGFNGWGTADAMAWDPVDQEYNADLSIPAGDWEFKVADEGWANPDFGPTSDPNVTVGVPTDIGTAVGANFMLSLATAGEYLFTLFDLSNDLQSGMLLVNNDSINGPADLTARAKSGKVSLYWTPIQEAVSYNVFRGESGGGPYDLIAAGHVTSYASYLDTTVTNGLTYYYVVTALIDGVESDPSNEANATPTSRTRR